MTVKQPSDRFGRWLSRSENPTVCRSVRNELWREDHALDTPIGSGKPVAPRPERGPRAYASCCCAADAAAITAVRVLERKQLKAGNARSRLSRRAGWHVDSDDPSCADSYRHSVLTSTARNRPLSDIRPVG